MIALGPGPGGKPAGHHGGEAGDAFERRDL